MDFILFNHCRPISTVNEQYEDSLFSCLRIQGEESLGEIEQRIQLGFDLDCCSCGLTFLGAACWLGRTDVVKLILNYLVENEVNTDISRCTLSSSPSNVNYKRSFLDRYDENGYTPLLLAISGGHLEICQLLVEAGVDINCPHQTSRQTPLALAIELSKEEIVTFLINIGVDVQLTDNVGITPLYAAIKLGKERIVEQLIAADCDVDVGSQDHAPIFLATRLGHLGIVKMLCLAGCYKDVSNKYRVTPVYEASLKGHVDVLQYLLDVDCSPNQVDMYQQSPLHVAVIAGHTDCVKLLVEAGANWKLRNHHGETAMDIAMEKGRTEILEFFLEEGIDVLPRASNSRGHQARLCGYLLGLPHGEDPIGYPLHISAKLKYVVAVFENRYISTLQLLIRGCAKLPIPHCLGVLPIFRNNSDLLKLLLCSGIQTVPSTLLTTDFHRNSPELAAWLKDFKRNPRSLQDICRVRVRRSLGNKVLHYAKSLPLPSDLKKFVMLKHM